MPDTIKPEQWPVQSQSTNRKCKGDTTSDTCAAEMKQISIWLANKTGNKQPQIARTMTCSKSTANVSGSCKQNDADGVCWWRWADHYVVGTYAMTSKYVELYVEVSGYAN